MQTLSSSQASPEVPINENFITLTPGQMFGIRQPVTTGVTWGFYGGQFNGITVADAVVTLTVSTTNYIVVQRSNGVVSTATTTTNWNNTKDYIRLYTAVTNATAITAYTDYRQAWGDQYAGAAYANMQNRLINGNMRIDQRRAGAAQTFTAAAALAYAVDRWYGYCTGANVTGKRVAGAAGFSQHRYQFTGAASCTAIGFGQRIKASDSYDLSTGGVSTLTVELANSLLTTVTWTAYYATTTDTFGTLAAPTRTQIATGTFTVNATLSTYSAAITVPAAAITGVEIVFTVGAQISGTWTIGRVSLEKSPVASSFNFRPYQQELLLAQEHYQTSYRNTAPGTITNTGSLVGYSEAGGNYNSVNGILPVEMFGVPTATVYSPSTGTAANLYAGAADVAAVITSDGNNLLINVNNVAVAANTLYRAHYTLEKEL